MCGEQRVPTRRQGLDRGSPPRVRGTAIRHPGQALGSRITPACAGNRGDPPSCRRLAEDHPRVCGEQAFPLKPVVIAIGSPPRVRGTVYRVRVLQISIRITPACAGNRASYFSLLLRLVHHPRVCGEQRPPLSIFPRLGGSPPRVRGTVKDPLLNAVGMGITPACAGNSWSAMQNPSLISDHPRVCGEQPCHPR